MKKLIAFYPELAIILGGIPEAIYYQQLYYWKDKGSRLDGFIYKTKEEIEEETTLSREQQDRIKKKLVDLGWLEVKRIKANGAPTLHYKTLKDFSLSISGKDTNQKRVKDTNVETCESHESITENTTETTTERGAKIAPRSETFQEWFDREIPKVESELYHERKKFISYWTEKSPGGKKFAWEIAKSRKGTFDIVLRWNTWTKKFREHLAAEERKRTEFFIKKKELEGGRRSSGGMYGIAELINNRKTQ